MQGRLYPLHIVRTEPAPFQTATSRLVGKGDDGQAYVLKRTQDGEHVPISEYICTTMARAIGMAAPECHIATMPDRKELCFASREEGGTEDGIAFLHVASNQPQLAHFADELIRWYAFDLFVRNFDRHMGNFLFRKSMLGVTMLGMDFGHALLAQDWPAMPPPLPACNTTRAIKLVQCKATLAPPSSAQVLQRLGSLPNDWLKLRLAEAPAAWLDAKVANDVCRWWRRGRAKRIRQLRTHLSNGRYLHLLAHSRSP